MNSEEIWLQNDWINLKSTNIWNIMLYSSDQDIVRTGKHEVNESFY